MHPIRCYLGTPIASSFVDLQRPSVIGRAITIGRLIVVQVLLESLFLVLTKRPELTIKQSDWELKYYSSFLELNVALLDLFSFVDLEHCLQQEPWPSLAFASQSSPVLPFLS